MSQSLPVFVGPGADVLHGSEAARHPGIGVELLHDGLAHSEVVGVPCGLWRATCSLIKPNTAPQRFWEVAPT